MLSVLYVDIFMHVKIAFLLVTKMTSQMPGICSDTVSDTVSEHIHSLPFPDNWSVAAVKHFSAVLNARTHHQAAQRRLVHFQNVQINWLMCYKTTHGPMNREKFLNGLKPFIERVESVTESKIIV